MTKAVPDWLAAVCPGGAVGFAELIAIVTVLSLAIIALNIYSVAAGLGVSSNGSPDSPANPTSSQSDAS